MANDRRLTADRFYGGTSQRLQLLRGFLGFLENGETTRVKAKDWILENTRAESRDAIDHHLGFLDAIELINLNGTEVSIDWRGRQYLESPEPTVLYNALRANVKGFESILAQLREGPMTDEDIMRHLKDEFEDIEMESPGVATRHREWLQVLGYVDRADGVSRLTEKGRRIESETETDGMTDREKVRELRSRLLQNDVDCIPDGRQSVSDGVYMSVREAYPDLCDDSYLCSEAHDTGRESPEWKHVVQEALQQLADDKDSRVRRDDDRGRWLFLPRFEPGEVYERSDLHNKFGGQRQRGISPCRGIPIVLLFTSFSETEEGYKDSIETDGTVVYTGEGTEGDMTFDHGNKAIRDHRDDDRELHLFRNLDDGKVEYVGQYECESWSRKDIPDANAEIRDGILFELEPVSETVYEGEEAGNEGTSPDDSFPQTEVESEVSKTVTELPCGSETTQRREAVREEVVRDEALVRDIKSLYDDRCQICGEKRLQGPENGYSEVHHLMPLGDDGPDIPENVVVVCPNHHIDFENGMLAIDPQSLEVNHRYESDVDGRDLLVEEGHEVGREYIAYHNQVVAYLRTK